MDLKTKTRLFQKGILTFWKKSGRKDLPWRQTRDPWKLLVAEILLRKTTSKQAASVYANLELFSPKNILEINVKELEEILAPLGINKIRAAQLKNISKRLLTIDMQEYKSDAFLRSLPGVGRYISNTVRCCAFDVPVPALDTNMIRVLERVFGWESNRSRAREDRKLWSFAENIVPKKKSREFNWAVLDFGASICTYRNPKCEICPISGICLYYQTLRIENSSYDNLDINHAY